jgi:septal ring factor EnvC (AmiA/AmiB activator)
MFSSLEKRMKRLIVLVVILSCGVLYAQQQRPPVTLDDYTRHIANCEISGDLKEKYIQQLETENATLQSTVANLQKQLADLQPKPATPSK